MLAQADAVPVSAASKEFAMRAGSDQSQLSGRDITTLVVNEKPIRLDMTFADSLVIARQFVVAMLLVQRTVIHQFLDHGANLFPVVTPGTLDAFLSVLN